MDFKLSEELTMLRDMVADFAKEQIAPFADEWDENHYFPYEEVVKPMAELGLFGTVIPEEYGGNEMGWLAAMIITEEIARASSSLRVQINMNTLGCAFTIYRYGTEEAKKEVHRKARHRRVHGRLRHHRAQRRLRRDGPEVHRRGQGRPLGAQRLQDLDLQRLHRSTA